MDDGGEVVFNVGPPVAPAHRFADPDEGWVYSPNLWPAALQSMPYFQNANWSAEIACLPGTGRKPRYEPVRAGPHLMGKFRNSVTF